MKFIELTKHDSDCRILVFIDGIVVEEWSEEARIILPSRDKYRVHESYDEVCDLIKEAVNGG